MIPKKIHYCWFGGNEYPELVKYCIASWKKYMPEYEIIEWNENNFDINSNRFVKEAFEARKFAFVSDYVRLYALATEGGIYMDTDVEAIKSLNSFLHHPAFTGGENSNTCITGTMGAIKNHPWIIELLKYYEYKSFLSKEGKIPNTKIITDITSQMYGFNDSSEIQNFNNELYIYPFEFFCAKEFESGEIQVTKNTYTIHHFNGSWLTDGDKKRHKRIITLKKKLNLILGERLVESLIEVKKKFF